MRVTLDVDGDRRDLDLEPGRTLIDALCDVYGLSSTYRGCADGTCGGCAVRVDGELIHSCLMLAVQCDGARVCTRKDLQGSPSASDSAGLGVQREG